MRIKLFGIASVFCAVASFAHAQVPVEFAAKSMETNLLLAWWERANFVCLDNYMDVNQACLDRTSLSKVLERRGMCRTASLPKQWAQCMVRTDTPFMGDPSLQKYLRDRQEIYTSGAVDTEAPMNVRAK